jgi:hypothetical protein
VVAREEGALSRERRRVAMNTIANLPPRHDLIVAYASERWRIYQRKEAGQPWPWTADPILRDAGSFTNVRREDDATTRWYAANIRERYKGRAEIIPTTLAFLWFNLIRTGETFTAIGDDGLCALDRMCATNSVEPLREVLAKQAPPYTNGAYRLTPPRDKLGTQDKVEGCLDTIQRFLNRTWRERWRERYCEWEAEPPTLAEMGGWYRLSYNIGTFQSGQNVACLKHVAPFRSAPDWMDWAYSGEGSRMGLNIALGRSLKARWNEGDWLCELRRLRDELMPRMREAGVPELCLQDFQNLLCEVSKLWRFAFADGRLKKSYKPPLDRILIGADRLPHEAELRADAKRRFLAGGIAAENLYWLDRSADKPRQPDLFG